MDAQNQQRHQLRQQKIKQQVDKRIADATESRGLLIVFTGNGKGKSTAAFGTVTRAVGHGQRAGVVQFIKGEWPCGERDLLAKCGVEFQVMSTGFTWETQNKETDRQAAQEVWQHAKRMLSDSDLDLVVLDELTYMVAYDYVDLNEVIDAVQRRPTEQTVIVTGRGCHRTLLDMADTVSEMRPIKHAFDSGLAARRGIDW
ncbi:cob(I)yrinic acid a,c-diamide adenosyltransferase [Leminorella grimontii]|uniref:Corrinoid adenosyltransferase n=1 Tax=Leminorella grimontii TaxID=82981 RepID=A0AAV5N101_9GAMM|nr:cob(I)yrinic acid a,c-diamide adenosyltransferase [Leminorella grimontii]KFC96375.1 Cob(I)alamin adenosyltransferase [Leminorella grimontii ATCC 33999 = DSM 5078]GKX54436.1 cob(I)yrinic acid a,c-diamide adenosyltransferase [Leminorella grimontii]GKX57855.1 cob(I)yrinic acid a,c-diamide adenosyltransferase [Leminorella grimontii]VFS59286.1 Cob(I)yrinic acid a,c-diamide adenosyltransferase [Leminorella grimontii]